MFETQKMQPFAQLNQMSQTQQQYYSQPYAPPQAISSSANYNDYSSHYQTRQDEAQGGL